MAQCQYLYHVNLAHNCLRDQHICLLSAAVANMPQLTHLDLRGNICQLQGAESLKDAIISHAILDTKEYVFVLQFSLLLCSRYVCVGMMHINILTHSSRIYLKISVIYVLMIVFSSVRSIYPISP